MELSGGHMAEEGEKGRFRQSWTVRVTNAKKKSSGAETQRCIPPPPKPHPSTSTNSDFSVKSPSRVTQSAGSSSQLATQSSSSTKDKGGVSRVKCFSPPPLQPLPVVRENEGSEEYDRGSRTDIACSHTPTTASYDSISLGQIGSGNVSSSDSSLSLCSTIQEGNSQSGRNSDWSTPRMGSPYQEAVTSSAEDIGGMKPSTHRHRFLSFPSDDTVNKDPSHPAPPYSIRVDFGLSVHNSLHVPHDNNTNSMLSNAIDNLLKVTGNDEMSAQKVERHVMEQTRILRAMKSSSSQLDLGKDAHEVQSSEVSSGDIMIQPDLVTSTTRSMGNDKEDELLAIEDTLNSSPLSLLGANHGHRLTTRDQPIQDQLPHRPPSVQSLPTVHTGEECNPSSCHCPYCCSCGSPRRKLNLSLRARANMTAFHQRSPSIQSVPVYFPSMEGLDGPKQQGCPLQRFIRAGTTHSTSENYRERSSSVEPSLVRSSVKELTQNFENLAANQHVSGSQPSLPNEVEGKSPHGRLRHASDHRRSSSLLSMKIPEEMRFSGEHFCAGSSERMDGSMLSLSSTSTADVPQHSYHHGRSLRVGVDGSVFKDRMNTLWSWFGDFSDQQRNNLLSRILDWCNSSQMHHLSLQMEPILHQQCPHNCQDLLSWLPSHISLRILSYLDPVSLCSCRLVSRNWFKLVSREQLWMRLCRLEKYQLSPQGQQKQLEMYTCPSDGTVCWMEMFAERYRLWRNWSRGYCTIRTFEGHTQGVSCVQFDENRIVSGSSDKTIKVWNIRTNTTWAALTLEGHSGDVRCLHLHGNRLVSGSSDRTIKVWELFTENRKWLGATCRVTMTGHRHTVRCLQSDEERVISGSYDHTLKIWNIKTGECTHTLRGHTDHVLCLQFKDNNLVSGSGDCAIIVWDMSAYQMRRTLRGHKAAVTTLQFDESRIISGSLDRLIKIWDYMSGQCVYTLDWIHSEGHTGVIRHLQADHLKMVSAADDRTLKVWSLESGERLLTLRSHTDGVTCVQFNDRVIVSGSYDKTVKLWDFSAC